MKVNLEKCYIREDYLLSMCIIFMYLNDDISI